MEQGYKKLIVWQKSIELVVQIYELSSILPKNERYGICSQIQRAAVSIPSNLAEGSRKLSKKEKQHFCRMAFGSASELETQIEILKRLPFSRENDFTKIENLLNEVLRMLNKMSY